MSLKLKLTLMLSFWLIFILIMYNVFVFYFFVESSANSEIELLQQKAYTLMERDIMHHSEFWENPTYVKEVLIPNEMIRIISPDSSVLRVMGTEEQLLAHPPEYLALNSPHSELDVSVFNGITVYLQMPIFSEGDQIGLLEIGRKLDTLDKYIGLLLSILIFTSIGAIAASLIGGYFYARLIFEPIRGLAQTMEAIQKSGTFRRIEVPTESRKDELGQLGHTFNEMIGWLETTFERQKQFIGDASHELRTPLTIIESYASLLRRWAASDPQLREEALDAIHSEAARLNSMIKDLLLLVDTDEVAKLNWVPFDLSALIESTASSLQLTFKRTIHVEFLHTDGTPLFTKGDPQKLKQLFIILLDNAIKYSKKDISVVVEKHEKQIKIEVADQGIGIAQEDLPHLFDRFYRTDKARNRKNGGVGLGLAIAQNIVNLHEGTVRVTSEPGVGTTVTIILPRKE